jgi:hypothetical protein
MNQTYIILGVLLIGGYLVYASSNASAGGFLSLNYFDKNGNPISTFHFPWQASVVNGVQGVSTFTVTATVDNTGEVPLTVTIPTASPAVVQTAFAGKSVTVAVGETKTITSNAITASQFEGTTTNIAATASGAYTYAGNAGTITKSGTTAITVSHDLVAGFTFGIGTGLGTSPPANCVNTGTTCAGSATATCCSPSTCSVNVPAGCSTNYAACGTSYTYTGNAIPGSSGSCKIYSSGSFKCQIAGGCSDGTSASKANGATCDYGLSPHPLLAGYCGTTKAGQQDTAPIVGACTCTWVAAAPAATCGGTSAGGDTACS